MKPKILFIHGFASCGVGQKSRTLMNWFGRDRVIAPDLPPDPQEAIEALEGILSSESVGLLVGSSLGGYFATWLQGRHGVPAVLINPAVAPYLLLEDYLGVHEDCHGRPFEVTPATLTTLRGMHRESLKENEHYLVLLATGDETLDYRVAANYYAEKDLIIHEGGNHRFENLADYLPRIQAWAEQHAPQIQDAT